MKKAGIKKLTVFGMLTGLAFLLTVLIRIPAFDFLTYDPKDIIIIIGGFLFGPLAVPVLSVVVSLLELVLISHTGFYGFIMQVIATCAYALPAAAIYSRNMTKKNAAVGLICGIVSMVLCMCLANYLITPFYMGMDRAVVATYLIPVFIPFNLIKASVNSFVVFLLYKPIVSALRKANLLPER